MKIHIFFLLIFLLLGCNSLSNSSSLSSIVNFSISFSYYLEDDNNEIINDDSTINKAFNILVNKLNLLNIEKLVAIKNENKINISSPYEDSLLNRRIQALIESDLEISFRDENGNILAHGKDILKEDNPVTAYNSEVPFLKFNLSKQGIQLFDNEIIPNIPIDGKVIVWLGYMNENDKFNFDKEDNEKIIDKYDHYKIIQNKLYTGGYDVLSSEEFLTLKYYNSKILTTITISDTLKNEGGFSGLGENSFVSSTDYNGNKIESIYNLIYSSNENYSFKLIK